MKTDAQHGARADSPFQCRTDPPQRILVVDDEPAIRRLHTDVLVDSGYEVVTAGDGAAAWEVLQLDSFHLLIVDNEMPNLSGIDLLKKLHAANIVVPVIMATGTLPQEELIRHPWLPIEAMLLKPYTVEQFLTAVSNVLRVAGDVCGQIPPPNIQIEPSPDDLRL